MLGLIAFAGLLIAGFAFMAVMGLVFLVVRIAFWAVFLPFRILFKLLWLPFGLISGLIGGVFTLAAGATLIPIVLTVGLAVAAFAAIAAIVALLIPAIPFVLLGLVIWALMRRQPATA
jgi:hypothetical protein